MTPTGSDPMLRYLNAADVNSLGGMDPLLARADVIDVLAQLRAQSASMPAETSVPLDGGGRAYALPARTSGKFAAAGVKWTAHRPDPSDGLPHALTLTLISDAQLGVPRGLVESAGLTAVRTAAVSGLALQHAAPRPIGAGSRIAVLGAGLQAKAHLAMLASCHPDIAVLGLWNRTTERVDTLLQNHVLPNACQIERYEQVEDLLSQHWDAILCCTAARVPFLDERVMAHGRIVLQIGQDEIHFDAIAKASSVVVDSWGSFCETSAKSLFRMYRAKHFDVNDVSADLAEAVHGKWRPAPDAAVYFSSFGLNVFDIALAARVLQNAADTGIGTSLPLFGA